MAGSKLRGDLRLLLVVGPALFATGCGLFGDPVQEQWESRDKYPSCGDVELAQGKQVEEQATKEIECLRQALAAGEGAELKVSYPTVEGDPIREYYRLTPEGALEVYTDSTDDSFSDRKWSSTECYTPKWLPGISCQ